MFLSKVICQGSKKTLEKTDDHRHVQVTSKLYHIKVKKSIWIRGDKPNKKHYVVHNICTVQGTKTKS